MLLSCPLIGLSQEDPALSPHCRSRPGRPDRDRCLPHQPRTSGLLTLVGSFPKLLVVTGLLNEVQEFFGEVGICEGVGLRIYISLSLWVGGQGIGETEPELVPDKCQHNQQLRHNGQLPGSLIPKHTLNKWHRSARSQTRETELGLKKVSNYTI